jgi:hypothetical protein
MQWMITRGTPIYGNPHVKPNAIHLKFRDGLYQHSTCTNHLWWFWGWFMKLALPH